MVRVLLACLLVATMIGACSGTAECGGPESASCTRVLFVGNSYTSVNDLPAVFSELARAGGHRVAATMVAPGGATLADHVSSADLRDRLATSAWQFVILQEQSQLPSIAQFRTQQMYPAARSLAREIRTAGATPMFFVTWAHRDGWPENGLTGYESMQLQIDDGYLVIARELNVPVAPVGQAWLGLHRQVPAQPLWTDDGSHPSMQGTYLAACTFFAAIFRQSPMGVTYLAGLPAQDAQLLQAAAAGTVLTDPRQWGLH